MTVPPRDPLAEQLAQALAGQYRLDGEIARGGMGVVYRAVDEHLERTVAIKVLPPTRAGDLATRERFLREARTAAALSHPHIVPIHQAAERDGLAWFVMPFVDGESLAERLAREGALEARVVAPILADVADALAYAHGRGVVHRDIKAENVLLDRASGRAMVTDFGIARVSEATPLTATGAVLGTVHYMSPEQVAGEPLDGRSDLYALGVLAYFALTGAFPFERPTAPAVLLAHVRDPVPSLAARRPSLPRWLTLLVEQLLAKTPDERPADATTVATLLREAPAFARAVESSVARRPAGETMATVEAEAVWARAAALEAGATSTAAPAPVVGAPPAAGRGFSRTAVRAAALDAGLDASAVDRALAEREAARAVTERPETAATHPVAGGPLTIHHEIVVARAWTETQAEEAIDEIRRTLGRAGLVTQVGRTITYAFSAPRESGSTRRVEISIMMRGDRTVLRASESNGALAGALFGGIVGGAGGGGGFGVLGGILAALQSVPLAVASALTMVGGSYVLARALFARETRRREAELRALLERLATLEP